MRMRTWSRGIASASAASAVVIATRPWAIRPSSRSSVRAATTLTSTQWHSDSFVKRNVNVSILRVPDRLKYRSIATVGEDTVVHQTVGQWLLVGLIDHGLSAPVGPYARH